MATAAASVGVIALWVEFGWRGWGPNTYLRFPDRLGTKIW